MKRKIITLLSLFALVGCGGSGNGNKTSGGISSSSSNVISSGSNSTNHSTNSSSTSSPINQSTSSSSSSVTLTPVPNPDKDLYLIGAAVWGWSNYAKLTFYTDNIYRGTFDLKTTAEGFVITDQTSFNGMVFKTSGNSNFTVNKYGTYIVMFTFDESKIDETWTKSTEKTNAATGYYKIVLDSAVEVPIDEEMVFVNGGSLFGWGQFMPLFQDETTGYFKYIYGLSTSGEGFVFTSEEDNEHLVYHEEDGTNITVQYAGDYEILFTYEDMSEDASWTVLKEQNGEADAYYKLVPLFKLPDDSGNSGGNGGGNTEQPPFTAGSPLYIFGGAVGSWENPIELPEVSEGVYSGKINLSTSGEGFVICELNVMSDKTGFCLHDSNGNNFTVANEGEYELTITWNDMSADTSWSVAKEVNSNEAGDAYYKLVPQFEIVDKEYAIEKLYLNGGNVGGWNSYVELTKVNETLFELELNLNTNADGFVITAQKSRGAADIVLKAKDGSNLNIQTGGKYKVSVSLVEKDATWTEITDTKGNYKESCFIKIEALDVVVETRTNIIGENATVTTSSNSSDAKGGDKVIDGLLGDANRWESTQGVDPQWLILDLGEICQFGGISIQWYKNAEAKDYTIEISTDGETWEVLETITNGADKANRLDEFTFEEAVSARYIKINGTSRVKTYGYSIDELYVWGVN